ncbi:MAG: hypothetical protein ACFB51_03925 [Anaerolineae bacterium]
MRLLGLTDVPLSLAEGYALTGGLDLARILPLTYALPSIEAPAYSALLAGFSGLFSLTAFGARVLSAFLGVIVAALTARLGLAVGMARPAVRFASVLIALMPGHVALSRTVSPAMLVQAAVLLLAVLWFVLLEAEPRDGLWVRAIPVFLTACVAGGLFPAGWMAAGLLAALIALHALLAPAERGRALLMWGGALAVGFGLWIPVLLGAWGSMRRGLALQRLPEITALDHVLPFGAELILGLPPERGASWALAGTVWILAVVGIAQLRSEGARLALPVWVAGPTAAALLLRIPIPELFAFVLPGMCLLAGAALTLFKVRHLGTWGLLVVTLGAGLAALYDAPPPEPDIMPLAADLQARAQPGDVLIATHAWQPGLLAANLPPGFPVPDMRVVEVLAVPEGLDALLDTHNRVWFVTFENPVESRGNPTGRWLLENAAWDGGSRYDVVLTLDLFQQIEAGAFDACQRIDPFTLCYSPTETSLSAGSSLPVAVSLALDEPTNSEFRLFVEVVPPQANVPVARQEGPPANGLRSTAALSPDDTLIDRRLVDLTGVPPGRYEVRVGIVNPLTGRRLLAEGGGDSILLGTLQVGEGVVSP